MRVYHDLFFATQIQINVSWSDPDPDPAKWYGSNRIRIRNTGYNPGENFVWMGEKSNTHK